MRTSLPLEGVISSEIDQAVFSFEKANSIACQLRRRSATPAQDRQLLPSQRCACPATHISLSLPSCIDDNLFFPSCSCSCSRSVCLPRRPSRNERIVF